MLGATVTTNPPDVAAAPPSKAGARLKRLIINADDLGLSYGITDAIIDTHQNGVLTSASLMVNQPATDYAVLRLGGAPQLDVGIHLNLCQGRPVLPAGEIPSLTGGDGRFLPPGRLSRKLLSWQVSTKEIENEFCAQIDRMREYGLEPSHADSHHRLHLYPAAVLAFRRAVLSRGINKARAPRKQVWSSEIDLLRAHTGSLPRRMATSAYNSLLQHVIYGDLKLPDAGVALHPQFRKHLSLLPDAWISALQHMTPGTYELWCHPGYYQDGFSENDPLRERRVLEVSLLTSPRVRDTLAEYGIELVSFKDL